VSLPHINVYPGLGEDHLIGIREALSGLATVSSDEIPPSETVYWITPKATAEQLRLPNLRAVIVPWAGVPVTLREAMAGQSQVALYNLHHNAGAAAEMAVGLLIAAARGIVDGDRRMRAGHWYGRMDDRQGISLFGRSAVVLGYGAIGARVGSALRALGMQVFGVRSRPDAGEYGPGDLDLVLEQAHALIVCAPLTAETEGMIDARRLGLLKSPRLVVNVGRGTIIDETALFESCRDGTIAGAGIDTWYRYPQPGEEAVFPSQFPFHQLDNVVMSPHRAGDGDLIEIERRKALIELLRDLIAGKGARAVDPEKGY